MVAENRDPSLNDKYLLKTWKRVRIEKIRLDASEGKFFLFCMWATSCHGLAQALLKEGQSKPHKNFNSQKGYGSKFCLKICTYLAGLVTLWKCRLSSSDSHPPCVCSMLLTYRIASIFRLNYSSLAFERNQSASSCYPSSHIWCYWIPWYWRNSHTKPASIYCSVLHLAVSSALSCYCTCQGWKEYDGQTHAWAPKSLLFLHVVQTWQCLLIVAF